MHQGQRTSNSEPKRILILRGGAIGDFILTIPVLSAIRQAWPEAAIELSGYPRVAQLGIAGGLVDAVMSLDSAEAAQLFSPEGLAPEAAARIAGFDLVLSYLHDPDGIVRQNLLKAGASRLVCASPIIQGAHAIDALLKPLEEIGIPFAPGQHARLCLSGQRIQAGARTMAAYGDRIVAIHPGSGSPKKNWPLDNYIRLADHLVGQTEFSVVFSVGEADGDMAAQIQSFSNMPVLPQSSLLELAQRLFTCAAYIGNDSGITHLAAAVGVPTIALFGSTDPAIWAPRGSHVRVLRHLSGALADIDAGEVMRAVRTCARPYEG